MEGDQPITYADMLDAAYDTAERPERFDDLVSLAFRFLVGKDEDGGGGRLTDRLAGAEQRLQPHAARIGRLLENLDEVGARAAARSFHARLVIEAGGQTVTGNPAASRLAPGGFPCSLEDLPFDRAATTMLRQAASGASGRQEADRVILATIEEPAVRSCLALIQRPPHGDGAVHVSISFIDWSPALLERLAGAFDLTPAEADVLEGYLLHLSPRQIADLRGRSPETIKAQSKAILRKSGCARMPDVMQLCAGIAYLLKAGPEVSDEEETWATPLREMHVLARPGGRQAAYYVYGAGSRPVLFVHGFIQGPFFTRRFLDAAAAADLRLICPSRPGFGHSSPSRSRRDFDETAAADAAAVLDSLGAGSCVIAATQGGASHAFRAARLLGHRVRGMLLAACGIPIDETQHLAHMDSQTRLAAIATRHAPSLMAVMTRLGIAAHRRPGGVEAFLRRHWSSSPPDALLLDDPEQLRIQEDGIRHIVRQGPETWVRCGSSAMADWTADADAVSAPKLWLHGERDTMMGAHFVEAFVSAPGRGAFEAVANAGANLIHEHPELAAARIAAIWDARDVGPSVRG